MSFSPALVCSHRACPSADLQLVTNFVGLHGGVGNGIRCVLLSGCPGHRSRLMMVPAQTYGSCKHSVWCTLHKASPALFSALCEVFVILLCFWLHDCPDNASLLNRADTGQAGLFWHPLWRAYQHSSLSLKFQNALRSTAGLLICF